MVVLAIPDVALRQENARRVKFVRFTLLHEVIPHVQELAWKTRDAHLPRCIRSDGRLRHDDMPLPGF